MRYQVYNYFFFKQKTAYELRISEWSSDVCSSDLVLLQLSVSGLSAVGSRTMESGRSASHPLKTKGYFKPAARSLLALCTCPLEPVTAAIDNVSANRPR